MSDPSMTREQWATVLEDTSPPTFGELVATLEERDFIPGEPAVLVEGATADDGPLTEDDEAGGSFPVYRLETEEHGGVPTDDGAEAAHVDVNPTPEANETASRDEESAVNDEYDVADSTGWADADFTNPESGLWVTDQVEREQWMGHKPGDKQPFSPWADPDAPVECKHHEEPTTCGECGHSAQFKWGYKGNYTDHEEALTWADRDPRLAGLAFIQREDDPLAFVDGDDVRCPETGEVHPIFEALLEHLGLTYADISVSGTGVHAVYRGSLPEGVKQAVWEIDTEPWGVNDDRPAIEIYDGKHVCIATGEHVPDTPKDADEWDNDALKAILAANDQLPARASAEDYEEFDASDYEPGATSSSETTEDIRDIYAALDRLNAQRVADRTIVDEWLEPSHADYRAFVPTWAPAGYKGTANFATSDVWKDSGTRGGKGGPACMAAIDAGLVSDRDCPRCVNGETWWKAVDHLRDLGFSIPELEDSAEYDDDPREVSATVDVQRAWEAAGRVSPDDLDTGTLEATDDGEAFACPDCGDEVDVVRAVALAEGCIDTCETTLDNDYSTAYARAREDYGAPLPEYYTTSDAIAEFDALLDVIGEVTFWHLNTDALDSEITGYDDKVGGDAVRALNPAWRDSESESSVLVFENGTIWDADTERTIDALRFCGLEAGLIDEPGDALEGEDFTEAYSLTRREYGAPLPRWDPAEDGAREFTPQLPTSDELVDGCDLDGVDTDALDDARESVEALIGEATTDGETPTVVTALPATGKTTGTVKTAADRPLSYLAPRKELQQQALNKADRWDVNARVLPVFADERVRNGVLNAAVSHVRENGKDRLRDRWAILGAAFEDLNEKEADTPDLGDIFEEDSEDADTVDLQRPTCDTAEGDHGVAWALAVHVARRLGYTPREIHGQARGLFGAPLPCSCDEDGEEDGVACEYSEGWERVRDADDTADLLVGSYIHAHVESVRTAYNRGPNGDVETSPRAVVVDEFPGEAFVREFGEEAHDFATWLARCLCDDVKDRRDMFDADLWDDEWVRAWLDGSGDEADDVRDATGALARTGDLLDARESAVEILNEVDTGLLDTLGLADALERVADADDPAAAFAELDDAIGNVNPEHPAAGISRWADEAVREPLDTATAGGSSNPSVDAADTDALPIGGDLRALVDNAVEAVEDCRDGAREAIDAAVTAFRGGREGCRRLAAWADDGYAHPDAHHLLTNIITPTSEESDDPDARRVQTSNWAFDPDATDGTVVDVVKTGEKARSVVDRNDHGALLQTPPSRVSAGGEDVPLVGLDATGRVSLWSNAIGESVDTADIHTNPGERAEFLENALSLRVLQASDRPRSYEGDPATKDTDGDVALLEAIADEYAGVEAPRQRGDEPTHVGNPAAITTKGVRDLLEADSRLDDIVAEWENYGNLTGANDLGDHRLAAVLGSQHYGDDAIERFCALAGREVDTSRDGGRGRALGYDDDLAEAYFKHMSDDQTMQAILRFARGNSGATVIARTSALREDLPVIGRAQVVDTWSDTATAIAREYRRHGDEFTAGDVADSVDVSRRQVRRVLAELVEAGYIRHVGGGNGVAKVYEPSSDPGAGEVDLPERGDAVASDTAPGPTATNQYYTWNVRVRGGDAGGDTPQQPAEVRQCGAPPSPAAVDGVKPPE